MPTTIDKDCTGQDWSRRALFWACRRRRDSTDGWGLAVGDTVHVKGHASDFTRVVESMQIERASVPEAARGQHAGTKLKEHVR